MKATSWVVVVLAGCVATSASAQFQNGSFETGDFTGWTIVDPNDPLDPSTVQMLGAVGYFFDTAPTDGDYAGRNGFDGGGPDVFSWSQDVPIPKDATVLHFDFRAVTDLFAGPTLDRSFRVDVEPAGGGSALASFPVHMTDFAADPNDPFEDTGLTAAALDLAPFKKQTVRVNFLWDFPEIYTGPGQAELDNVRLLGKKTGEVTPAKLTAKLDFAKPDKDSIVFKGTVPVTPGFDPMGQALEFRVGALTVPFTLDEKGKGTAAEGKAKLKENAVQPGFAKLDVKLKKGSFAADLAGLGLTNGDIPKSDGVVLPVSVHVLVDGRQVQRVMRVPYKAKLDKKGTLAGKP